MSSKRKTRAGANHIRRTSKGKRIHAKAVKASKPISFLDGYPRCAAYLKAMWVRLDDPGLTPYWAAVILSSGFSDDRLAKLGTINFETMTGDQLMAAFEELLAVRASGQGARAKVKRGKGSLGKITAAVAPEEIIAAMTPKGAWKAATLAKWGVPWPPPKGWRQRLIENFESTSQT
ncbi:hypothetical protein [uncultured Nitratireductor sp.]|uniref:hypothetical protein n=1 Tax=uncultured Nitratireductor sp. TaxID=520953 RepID=UPI00261BDBD7|nr:hypothetical protein [uncultured Nitratireductor sp.]